MKIMNKYFIYIVMYERVFQTGFLKKIFSWFWDNVKVWVWTMYAQTHSTRHKIWFYMTLSLSFLWVPNDHAPELFTWRYFYYVRDEIFYQTDTDSNPGHRDCLSSVLNTLSLETHFIWLWKLRNSPWMKDEIERNSVK